MSRKIFLVLAGVGFLVALISMFFGASIYNANENVHITYLNEMDKINFFNADEVPALTRLAALVSIPFLIAIIALEMYVFIKSSYVQVKNISMGLVVIAGLLILLSILTLNNALFFDFSKWGFAWVFGGLATIAGNTLCVFIKK